MLTHKWCGFTVNSAATLYCCGFSSNFLLNRIFPPSSVIFVLLFHPTYFIWLENNSNIRAPTIWHAHISLEGNHNFRWLAKKSGWFRTLWGGGGSTLSCHSRLSARTEGSLNMCVQNWGLCQSTTKQGRSFLESILFLLQDVARKLPKYHKQTTLQDVETKLSVCHLLGNSAKHKYFNTCIIPCFSL